MGTKELNFWPGRSPHPVTKLYPVYKNLGENVGMPYCFARSFEDAVTIADALNKE